MARAIALAQTHAQQWHAELFRSTVVIGCAMALIMAGRALPF